MLSACASLFQLPPCDHTGSSSPVNQCAFSGPRTLERPLGWFRLDAILHSKNAPTKVPSNTAMDGIANSLGPDSLDGLPKSWRERFLLGA